MMGLLSEEIQLTAQMSHLELSKMPELQMVKSYHWPRNEKG